jgi:hypothetical protein
MNNYDQNQQPLTPLSTAVPVVWPYGAPIHLPGDLCVVGS